MVTMRASPWPAVWAGALALLVHVPDARSATLRQLVEVVDFTGLSVSPDGRLVAFRTEQASVDRNTYDTVWYVQPVDGSSPPRRLGEAGAPLRDGGAMSRNEPALWSPDGKWIFYRAVLDGRVDIWRAAVDGSRTGRVTRDPANVRRFSLDDGGAALLYGVGATREAVVEAELEEYDRGVHIDRNVPLGDPLFRSGHHEGRLATQRLVDNELVRFPLLSQVPDRWKSVDLATGETIELAAGRVPAGAVAPADVPQDLGRVLQVAEEGSSGRIAFLARADGPDGAVGQIRLAMLPGRGTRRPVICAAAPCVGGKITAIAWRPGSDEVVFAVTDDALGQSLFRWNVVSGNVQPVVASRGHLGGGGRWDPGPCAVSSEALVCVAAEADRPPRLERIGLESGERRVLFDPNAALAHDMATSATVRPVEWADAQGRRYSGQFYPAAADGTVPPPLFVVYYRCAGFVRGGMGDEWPLATLARAGIAALCINAAPPAEDAVERYEQGRAAIEGAVAYLASRGEVDPARVGIGGLSMGAEVALWTAMNSCVARAISIGTPVVSPQMRLLLSPWEQVHFSRLRRHWQLGAVDETPERWRTLSPAFDVERVRVPVLMQMSEQEYRGSFDYTIPLIGMRRADVYAFPHEPHQKYQPRHKLAVYQRNLDWFRFWLLGAEDDDPAKAGQYARWREMRQHAPGAD